MSSKVGNDGKHNNLSMTLENAVFERAPKYSNRFLLAYHRVLQKEKPSEKSGCLVRANIVCHVTNVLNVKREFSPS